MHNRWLMSLVLSSLSWYGEPRAVVAAEPTAGMVSRPGATRAPLRPTAVAALQSAPQLAPLPPVLEPTTVPLEPAAAAAVESDSAPVRSAETPADAEPEAVLPVRTPLTAEECLVMAVRHAVLGDVVSLERRLARVPTSGTHRAQRRGETTVEELTSELLAWRQADLRNQAGLNSLRVFYRLAEVDFGLLAIDRSLKVVREMGADVDAMMAGGLGGSVDPYAVRIQELELIRRRHDLLATRVELQAQLNTLTGQTLCQPPCTVSEQTPEVSWDLLDPVDCETAFAQALCHRAELVILRLLDSPRLNDATLQASRGALPAELTSWLPAGVAGHWSAIFNPTRQRAELAVRRSQLRRLREDRQQAVSNELIGAIARVEGRRKELEMRTEVVRNRRDQLDRLVEKRRIDGITGLDLAQTRLLQLQAEADQMSGLVQLRIAEAELRAAQGLLVFDGCGLPRGG